jgi:hypothetical protein
MKATKDRVLARPINQFVMKGKGDGFCAFAGDVYAPRNFPMMNSFQSSLSAVHVDTEIDSAAI